MNVIKSCIKKAKLRVLESVYSKRMIIDLDRPIFTFTFDDAPLSACTTGARILECTNATGTFYVSLGLSPNQEDSEPYIGSDEIRLLHSRGHDIQCHTFRHLNLRKHSIRECSSDCMYNRTRIVNSTRQARVSHFAYPFGAVGLSAKRVFGDVYLTMRTVDFGINFGSTDMTHLRAIEIFSNSIDRKAIKDAIQGSLDNNSWTIFFTHDVKDQPSRWGARPEDLQWVVNECNNVGGRILNINQAYNIISGNALHPGK